MNYDKLIERVEEECRIRKISHYQLSAISSLPKSTIYGIFNHKYKAQIDTLCIILEALGLQLSIVPSGEEKEQRVWSEADWSVNLQELSFEKRNLVKNLVLNLKD